MLTQIKFLDTELEKAIHHLEPLGSPFAMVSIAISVTYIKCYHQENDPRTRAALPEPKS